MPLSKAKDRERKRVSKQFQPNSNLSNSMGFQPKPPASVKPNPSIMRPKFRPYPKLIQTYDNDNL